MRAARCLRGALHRRQSSAPNARPEKALGSMLETRRTLRLIDQRLRIARAVHMRRVQSDHAAPNVESTAYRNTWLNFTPVDNVERDANDVAFKRACMARRDALSCRAGAKKSCRNRVEGAF